MKLVVVGGGIGGSALTRLARERGHEVTLISSGVPDSLAATVVLRRGYHAGSYWGMQAYEYAIECYQRWGIEMRQGALSESYRRAGEEPRPDRDWLLLDPAAPLVAPDVNAEVVSVKNGRAWLEPGRCVHGDVVVVAGGARGNFAREGKITWGVTLTHSSPGVLRDPDSTRVYQWAPYRTIVCGVTGGTVRLGSSSAKDPASARDQMQRMLDMAWSLGWLRSRDGWNWHEGARLKTEKYWGRDEPTGSWYLGGFHRTGYALAPGAARHLLVALDSGAQSA